MSCSELFHISRSAPTKIPAHSGHETDGSGTKSSEGSYKPRMNLPAA